MLKVKKREQSVMDTLFEMPERTPRVRGPRKQQELCKRCDGSYSNSVSAYCERFDLCIDFHKGMSLLAKNGQSIACDGKKCDW